MSFIQFTNGFPDVPDVLISCRRYLCERLATDSGVWAEGYGRKIVSELYSRYITQQLIQETPSRMFLMYGRTCLACWRYISNCINLVNRCDGFSGDEEIWILRLLSTEPWFPNFCTLFSSIMWGYFQEWSPAQAQKLLCTIRKI